MADLKTENRFTNYSDEELIVRIRDLSEGPREWVFETIEAFAEARRRGIKIAIHHHAVKHLILAAEQKLLPELVYRFLGQKRLLDSFAAMPTEEQQRIATGEGFKVYDLNGDHRLISFDEMSAREREQVFDGANVNSMEDQLAILRDRKAAESESVQPAETYTLYPGKGRMVVHGESEFTVRQLKAIIARLEKRKQPEASR